MKKNVLKIVLGCFIGLLIGCVISVVVFLISNSKIKGYEEEISELKYKITVRDNNIKLKEMEIGNKEAKLKQLEQVEKQDELNSKINELDSKVLSLEKQKEELESKIKSLKEDVIKIKGEGKNFPAGYLSAGKDFEAGRYKIYGGSGNFAVYSSTGKLRVNIILGDNPNYHQVNEYLYSFSDGDEIKANSQFKMIPIE